MEVFWERGYQAVSVSDLVQRTGLNRHSLYARYGNKFGLLHAALDRYREAGMEGVRDALTKPGTALQRIEQLLALRAPDCPNGFFRRMTHRGCFAYHISSELRDVHPEFEESAYAIPLHLEEVLAGVIREGQVVGEITSRLTAEDLAAVVLAGFLAPLLLPLTPPRTHAILSVLRP